EGLDLPEVSLVAILDADKQGFLRSGTSLIQTIGRAARNVSGAVIMYADEVTPAMADAIGETDRRRAKQIAFNEANGIDPQPIRKRISDITEALFREEEATARRLSQAGSADRRSQGRSDRAGPRSGRAKKTEVVQQIESEIESLQVLMRAAAETLKFELAARYRDQIADLRKELRQVREATR
ncbi:MAG: UvrB/UvrC motif-containing protein, partial [Bifidobacteriaceae bacterium]|nr:UvrB/UvrC motif-containing protein [Bifidobacteriaceae bacterium]